MKHTTRLSWTIGLAIAAPVMALTGCPGLLGQPTGASPSPSAPAATPSPTPTPALRTTAIFTQVAIVGEATASTRTFTIKNRDSVAKDLTNWAVSYEYETGGTVKMIHARIVGANNATVSVAPSASLTVAQTTGCTSGNCVKMDTALGSSTATQLDLQATHGGLVLYKAATDSVGLSKANMVDYVQYGPAKSYGHVADAVSAGLWESATATASAPGADGKIGVITEGASGSTNWKKL